MRIPRLALLVPLLAGCISNPTAPPPAAMRLRGEVVGLERPATARIDVYRMGDRGIAERLHGADVTPAADGSFTTSVLLPGRYLLALRAGDRPVSTITLPVPPAPYARLVARDPPGRASLELRHDLPGVKSISLLLTQPEEGVPVTDRRTVAVRAGVTSLVRGLTPGVWRLDVVGAGATTEIIVPDAEQTLLLTVSPPAVGTGAQLMGRVLREDGSRAVGLVVSVRAIAEGATDPADWGRYARTDSDGGYRLAGLTPGRALLRVECRDALYSRLPPPEIVTIPPSGVLRRSFVVGP